MCFVDTAEGAVELGFAELGAGAVDGADGGWVTDAVAVWGEADDRALCVCQCEVVSSEWRTNYHSVCASQS